MRGGESNLSLACQQIVATLCFKLEIHIKTASLFSYTSSLNHVWSIIFVQSQMRGGELTWYHLANKQWQLYATSLKLQDTKKNMTIVLCKLIRHMDKELFMWDADEGQQMSADASLSVPSNVLVRDGLRLDKWLLFFLTFCIDEMYYLVYQLNTIGICISYSYQECIC